MAYGLFVTMFRSPQLPYLAWLHCCCPFRAAHWTLVERSQGERPFFAAALSLWPCSFIDDATLVFRLVAQNLRLMPQVSVGINLNLSKSCAGMFAFFFAARLFDSKHLFGFVLWSCCWWRGTNDWSAVYPCHRCIFNPIALIQLPLIIYIYIYIFNYIF